MAIDTESEAVRDMKTASEVIDDLRGGTKRMREQNVKYLPMQPAEEQKDYTYRLNTTTLYNVLERTIQIMSAKPFSGPAALEGFENGDRKAWIEDMNLEGQKLELFAKEVFQSALAHGISYLYVDYPTVVATPTLHDIRTRNIRPYTVSIPLGNMLGWKSKKVNGVEVLTEVRFFVDNDVPDPDDEFNDKTVRDIMQIMRGQNGRGCPWQRHRENEKTGLWEVIASGVLTVQEIPFIPVYAKRKGFMQGTPPLSDLADLNVKHWQSSSDQDSILHFARVPILYAAGWSDDKDIQIGSGRMIKNSSPTARVEFVEHSGAAIGAGEKSLAVLEEQMMAIGAELLLRKPTGDMTATQSAIDSAAGVCDLSEMVSAMSDAFNVAFEFMGEYSGTAPGSVQFYTDFAVTSLSAADMTTLMNLQSRGVISKRVLFEETQRRNLISDIYDFETVKAEADEELQLMAEMMAETAGGDADGGEGGGDGGEGGPPAPGFPPKE